MTRGPLPLASIEKAMRHAEEIGYRVLPVYSRNFPCDFVITCSARFAFVKVRGSIAIGYGIPEIREYCADEIARLRSIVVGGTTRELWVREGPDRWHRYLITDDAIETVPEACGIVVPVPGEGGKGYIPAARMEIAAGPAGELGNKRRLLDKVKAIIKNREQAIHRDPRLILQIILLSLMSLFVAIKESTRTTCSLN